MCDRTCPECGLPSHSWVGRVCKPCYDYHRRYGTYTRKHPVLRLRKAQNIRVCQHCKMRRPKQSAGGKRVCRNCAAYYRRNGRLPPAHLRYEVCRNEACRRPLIRSNQGGGTHGGSGRCKTCHSYWHKHKSERKPRLVKRQAPQGWCECGSPAVTCATLSAGCRQWDEALCASCYKLEEEVRKEID